MKNYSYGLKKLKIIEQIAIVFFIAVVIPLSISGFIINNINQQSVRHQLRESAILVASMVSDEVEFFMHTNESTLDQIAFTLNYLPTEKQKQKFINDITKNYPNCENIIITKTPEQIDNLIKKTNNYEKPILSTILKDGSSLIIMYNASNWDNQLFKSLENDTRQVYIIDKNKHLIASHNYSTKSFDDVLNRMPKELEINVPEVSMEVKNSPTIYLRRENPDLTIIVNTTKQITKDTILTNRVNIILSIIFAILAMVILIGFYIYYLYINIKQLFKAIIAISKGNYQRQIRLITTSFTPYEVVFLANEFNQMVLEIHKSYIDLKKKNIKLKQLNEFRSNLLDTVSHELRTPLTSIQGYTSRLMRKDIVIDEETKQKSLRIIKEQTQRLKRLIDDLLTIPDIEGLRLHTENKVVELSPILSQAELLLRKRDNHEIIINNDTGKEQVYGDKGRLEQVFVNLFENAIKYAYPESPIIVDIEPQKDEKIIIKVKNQCDLISQQKLNKLFDKFVRLDDEMTRTTRGTGLGLFIVKGLIEAMEGTITLESNKEFGFIATITLNTTDITGNE